MSERVTIEQATAQQLRDFAALMYGIPIGGTENKATMLGKLQAVGYTKDDIPVVKAAEPGAPKGAAVPGGVELNDAGKECLRITIPEEDKDGGQEPVWVSVNGVGMFIERGKPQLVPLPYIEALQNAVQYVYPQYTGGEGGLQEPRKVHSYPFSAAV